MYFSRLVFFFILISSTFSSAQNWALAKDKNGVQIYTRFIEGWDLKQFKGVVNIQCSVSKVEKTLRDAATRSKWMYNTSETYDVKKVSDNEIYAYSRVAAPWPVYDRDNVTKYSFKKISDKELYVYYENVKGLVPEKSGVIRLKKMEGYWHFKETKSGQTQVVQVCASEAGGTVPSWLANSAIIDNPYHTLFNLKNYIEGRH